MTQTLVVCDLIHSFIADVGSSKPFLLSFIFFIIWVELSSLLIFCQLWRSIDCFFAFGLFKFGIVRKNSRKLWVNSSNIICFFWSTVYCIHLDLQIWSYPLWIKLFRFVFFPLTQSLVVIALRVLYNCIAVSSEIFFSPFSWCRAEPWSRPLWVLFWCTVTIQSTQNSFFHTCGKPWKSSLAILLPDRQTSEKCSSSLSLFSRQSTATSWST